MSTPKTLSRDFKHVKRHTPGGGPAFNGWVGLGMGLALGLSVALAVHLHYRNLAPAEPQPAADAPPASAVAPTEEPAAPAADVGPGYDFYDMLPKFEVVVPEKEKPVRPDAPPAAVDRPGPYVLQAGSYRDFAEADRIRSQLALQGIQARVQKVSVDADTWHRVRIGPISDPAELERIRQRLREADIDVLVIRVPE